MAPWETTHQDAVMTSSHYVAISDIQTFSLLFSIPANSPLVPAQRYPKRQLSTAVAWLLGWTIRSGVFQLRYLLKLDTTCLLINLHVRWFWEVTNRVQCIGFLFRRYKNKQNWLFFFFFSFVQNNITVGSRQIQHTPLAAKAMWRSHCALCLIFP